MIIYFVHILARQINISIGTEPACLLVLIPTQLESRILETFVISHVLIQHITFYGMLHAVQVVLLLLSPSYKSLKALRNQEDIADSSACQINICIGMDLASAHVLSL